MGPWTPPEFLSYVTIAFAVGISLAGCQPASHINGDAATLSKARSKGIADAKTALAKGKLLLKEYPPLPSPAEHGEYVKLLKEKCGCDYEVVQMEDYSKSWHEEVNGWNDIMNAEIKSTHGDAIFYDLHVEARKRWEASRQPKEKR